MVSQYLSLNEIAKRWEIRGSFLPKLQNHLMKDLNQGNIYEEEIE